MRITIDGGHNILSCVNIPLCDVKYTKFGEGFFDSEALGSSDNLEDIVRERFESFSTRENGWKEFSEWEKKNEDKAWYDLREGENGGLYIVAVTPRVSSLYQWLIFLHSIIRVTR